MQVIIFIILLIYSVKSYSVNYYVKSTGCDYCANSGTLGTPFKTIGRAAGLVHPGDTVFVMNGTYTNSCSNCNVVSIKRKGTPTQWIVFTNYQDHTPLLSFNGWSGIFLNDSAAYIKINGFKIRGNNANVSLTDALNQSQGCLNPGGSYQPLFNGNGISVEGRAGRSLFHPHHITITNNEIYECGGGGISAIQADYITIENNLVYNNSWYTIFGTSGISLYQLWNFDSNTGYRNFILNNYCYGNRLYVPWVSAPCAITDGNGIIIDDSKNTQNGSTLGAYNGRTYIANNLVVKNGGSGIHTFESSHVDIVNNTAYQNSQSVQTRGEIFASYSKDVNILNNIIVPITNEPVNTLYRDTNVVYDYNLYFNTNNITALGANDIKSDPQFISPDTNLLVGNFNLSNNSPAINKGTNLKAPNIDFTYKARPLDGLYDIGAYEKAISLLFERSELKKSNTSKNTHEIVLYPNPATEVIHLELVKNEYYDCIEIKNIIGVEMCSFKNFSDSQLDLIVSTWPAGAYIISLQNNFGREVLWFTKK